MTKQHKVVINKCFGGFSLSKEAVRLAKSISDENSGWQLVDANYGFIRDGGIERHDLILVSVVEKLGDRANGSCSKLRIKTIDSNMYKINDYDGMESIEIPSTIDWVVIE